MARFLVMDEESWAKLAIYIWLSAYVVFFIGACVLMNKSKSCGRWLIFCGTFLLLLVNLALFAVAHDVIELIYSPYFETADWKTYMGDEPHYPEWQRYFYWGTSLADVLGKILAGIGMIMEGRQLTKIMRERQMAKFQPDTHLPTN